MFLSCSLREEDASLVRWFRDFAEALEFEVIVPDHPEPRPPPEKIRADVAKTDCFAALISRREKLAAADKWTGPQWVQNEIGIAFDARKHVLAFVETGIDPEGLTPWVSDYVMFNRDKLGEAAPRIARYLVATRALVAPRLATQEELPTIRALASELVGQVNHLCRIDQKLDSHWQMSSLLATLSGRVYSIPQELRDDLDAANTAYGRVQKAVSAVKKFDPPYLALEEEKPEAKAKREAQRVLLLQELRAIRDAEMPAVAKAAVAFWRVGFPENERTLKTMEVFAAGKVNSKTLALLPPDEEDDNKG